MKRVLIVGCPGAGKSTVAKEIAKITGLPLIHLDRHYWLPGWQRPEKAAYEKIVAELIDRPVWIIDGNYSSTLQLRLRKADTLIHLDYPTWLCLWRVLCRTFKKLGRSRDSELIAGCKERFDWPFLHFVIRYRQESRNRDMQIMAGFSGQLYRFTSPSSLAAFINDLRAQNCRDDSLRV